MNLQEHFLLSSTLPVNTQLGQNSHRRSSKTRPPLERHPTAPLPRPLQELHQEPVRTSLPPISWSKSLTSPSYTVLVRRYQNQGIILPQPAGTPEPSTYSATDDDDRSFGSTTYDDLLPARTTQVSTPETQHSWPTDTTYSAWTSPESFDVLTSSAPAYSHAMSTPLTVAVSTSAQWDWASTSMNAAHSPMLALASPRNLNHTPHQHHNIYPHDASLVPYDAYAPNPAMLSPTTAMHYGAHVARGPTSSPVPIAHGSPSYQNPQAVAHLMRYEMRRDPPYQY